MVVLKFVYLVGLTTKWDGNKFKYIARIRILVKLILKIRLKICNNIEIR
jgi:hypothetical protein